ncbi:MAG: metal ABC transporter substrate-binding protein [Campylobacterota bacterium]|nr:metal ABC transporter substrate-binding protein [Campylobacterota bacterium]
MKNFVIIALVLVVGLLSLQLFVAQEDSTKESLKPIISVSTFSLYDITKHIAGDSIEIVNILPFGVDPHSFEPTPKLMASIQKSSLSIYSGAGLEPWIENIIFKNRSINMSKHVKLRDLGEEESEHHKHHDDHCMHNAIDPHYWLDFENMKKATSVIAAELIKIVPKNKSIYLKNRDNYLNMLKKLDETYAQKLNSCRINTVILSHNSIGYLAANYRFHAESLSGLSPEAHPTPSDIKRVFQEIEEDGVSTIFYENFVSNKAIKTIAKDKGIKVEVLQSLGNITADEARANKTYEDIMYLNLQKLSKALECR